MNEIVSTHGYSQNQIVVWKYPSMSKLTTLVGHSTRVLYLATSPDGQTVVTGAGDTLRHSVMLEYQVSTVSCWAVLVSAVSHACLSLPCCA